MILIYHMKIQIKKFTKIYAIFFGNRRVINNQSMKLTDLYLQTYLMGHLLKAE